MREEQRLTCQDLVNQKFEDHEKTYKDMQDRFEGYEHSKQRQEETGQDHNLEEYKTTYLESCETFYEYVNQDVLSWDYIEPNTFDDQIFGYYRLQLSWGGPSDEYRIFVDETLRKENVLNINCIEYWYMDWFDGASLDVPKDSIAWEICQMFLDLEF